MDNSDEIQYNEFNAKGETLERIDLKKLVPINDVNCKHESVVPDPSDETDDYIAYKCANPACGRGVLISKHE